MEIPIIILNWNGFADTEACLESLMKQTFQDFKVYLVDNGSKDESPEKLKANYLANPKIELILNQEKIEVASLGLSLLDLLKQFATE